MTLLYFINLGNTEIILLLIISGIPFLLTLYAVIDIVKSTFKTSSNQILFLLLVLLFPIFGSIIYLIMRNNFK